MAEITIPKRHPDPVSTISQYLDIVGTFHKQHAKPGEGMLGQLWYRGVKSTTHKLVPGVYRKEYAARAATLFDKPDAEDNCLRLEREMLSQFRTAGAPFLKGHNEVDIYFTAQHFGLPTRLLDWSTNPLAALFFALDPDEADGMVYAMDARNVIPEKAKYSAGTLPQAVVTLRHPLVKESVGRSFWRKPDDAASYVLPVRPDIIPGRMGQQSSCFTLHAYKSGDVENGDGLAITIRNKSKTDLMAQLHQLNINQFTTYYDLDHLSKEIKRGFGF